MRARIPAAAALAALLAVSLLALPARASGEGQGEGAAGKVTFLAGDATRAPGAAAKAERLAVGSAVRAGDVVETRKRTRLEVRLADGSVLRLGPLSRAEIAAASFGRTPEERNVSGNACGRRGWRRWSARDVLGRMWSWMSKIGHCSARHCGRTMCCWMRWGRISGGLRH